MERYQDRRKVPPDYCLEVSQLECHFFFHGFIIPGLLFFYLSGKHNTQALAVIYLPNQDSQILHWKLV